jgi:putative Holliday junction resolvase
MTHQTSRAHHILALDVGTKRVGVALASTVARLPHPHTTLHNDDQLWSNLQQLCHEEQVGVVVVGLPRGLDGQETEQTAYSRHFADQLSQHLGQSVVIEFQDEAVTSAQATAELAAAKRQFARADVDALAATYILEDYLREHARGIER